MTRLRRLTAVPAIALAVGAAVSLVPVGSASGAATDPARADFNGDGFEDVALGAPGEDLRHPVRCGHAGAGTVTVVYGGPTGLVSSSAQLWHQGTPGVPGRNEPCDAFGASLAFGDLDGDGYTDLAVAAAQENGSEGAVTVLFGSSGGITSEDAVLLQRGRSLSGDPHWGSLGEYGLTVGRFDTTVARPQLAILANYADPVGGSGIRGAIHIVWGFRDRIRERVLLPGEETTPGATACDWIDGTQTWISNISAGPFDDDPGDELVVGVMDCENEVDLFLLPGGPDGPGPATVLRSVACCYIDIAVGRDVAADRGVIAVGVRSCCLPRGGGTVFLIHSDPEGNPIPGSLLIDQDTPGVPGGNEAGDAFGMATELRDLDGDGVLDLVVGAPDEDLAGEHSVGAVTVVIRTAAGTVDALRTYAFDQDDPGIPGRNEEGDWFGGGVAVNDILPGGAPDVVVYSRDGIDGAFRPGLVTIVPGESVAATLLHQGSPGIPGRIESRDGFGSSLVTGWWLGT